VVKANAYGHGAIAVSRRAMAEGAWGLGVIGVDEAEDLRRAGIDAPVLVLGDSPASLAERLIATEARVTVTQLDLGAALSAVAGRLGRTARVHVKVETGLNRYGLEPEEAVALADRLRGLPNLEVEGLFTHFATADTGDKEFSYEQFARFRECAERLSWVPIHHAGNTGTALSMPELSAGMLRIGVGLYGCYPSAEVERSVELRPVLSLRSRVARVRTLSPGETVGYGRTWEAKRESRVALVMAGYGDGVRRALSNRGEALVRGARAPFAGRVAMDMLALDVTDVSGVAEGDEVTLIGRQGDEEVSADEVGELCGSISYEVLTGISARVPRLFIEGGRVVARQDLAGYRPAP
jgi:alanine racemase